MVGFKISVYSDQSAFKGVTGQDSDGFRLYSSYATFVYSQLQTILPDSFLGDFSDLDHYQSIDLTSTNVPFESISDFLENTVFADLVKQSDLPAPTHFVEQSLSFYKSLCIFLLKQYL